MYRPYRARTGQAVGVMTLDEAIALARRFHDGQVDKAGRPYIEHPLRVMDRVTGDLEKLAAVLHDVLEDTELSSVDLIAAGCPERVLTALDALTRRAGEPYEQFVARAAADPLARAVKLADIGDNSDPVRLAVLGPDDSARLQAKYAHAREIVAATVPVEPDPDPPFGIPDDRLAAVHAAFDCAACGRPAGRIELHGDHVLITSPLGRVWALAESPAVGRAVADADLPTLHRFDFTPFWCPDCPASYCDRHWSHEPVMDEGFYDCTYGTCPSGHRTILDD